VRAVAIPARHSHEEDTMGYQADLIALRDRLQREHTQRVYAEAPLSMRPLTRAQHNVPRAQFTRMVDGPDALPSGKPQTRRAPSRGVRLADERDTEFLRASELYRVRTQPDLYDDWQVDMTLDLAYTQAREAGRMLADCHHCHTTTPVTPDTVRCSTCWTEY